MIRSANIGNTATHAFDDDDVNADNNVHDKSYTNFMMVRNKCHLPFVRNDFEMT